MSTTCRTLQSLLGNVSPQPMAPKQTFAPRSLQSPIEFLPSSRAKINKSQNLTPSRGANKRRREDTPQSDKENTASDKYSTPKRQRKTPPSLPLGLAQADFDALETPATPTSVPKPEPEKESIENGEWNSEDDGKLVALVLEKLMLKKSDWDDCAKRLGKGKDSIGERWRILVGEGEVGLRRGGRKARPSIEGAWS